MAYRATKHSSTKHSSTGFSPNSMMFGQEVREPVDLVVGLPPDTDAAPSAREYIQHLRERLELAHDITSGVLGESVKRAKRQYGMNCYHRQYQVGYSVWYLIKGTWKERNKVKKFLPSSDHTSFLDS
ncbi:uncharacterized protein V6R79_008497 [Siganus canaliculatus]